mmetsp:Transcript_39244/g.83579  ORF Transcript_39244/g.83579 Transcript_39244/m.83579 type:complete len:264 (+) Transcript_39244:1875-2666(+)
MGHLGALPVKSWSNQCAHNIILSLSSSCLPILMCSWQMPWMWSSFHLRCLENSSRMVVVELCVRESSMSTSRKSCANRLWASEAPSPGRLRPNFAKARSAARLAASEFAWSHLQAAPFLQRPATKSQQTSASLNDGGLCTSTGPTISSSPYSSAAAISSAQVSSVAASNFPPIGRPISRLIHGEILEEGEDGETTPTLAVQASAANNLRTLHGGTDGGSSHFPACVAPFPGFDELPPGMLPIGLAGLAVALVFAFNDEDGFRS